MEKECARRGVVALAAVVLALLASLVLTLALAALGVGSSPSTAGALRALEAASVAMFLGAGSLCFSLWRISSDPRAAYFGSAALVYAGGTLVLGYLGSVAPRDASASLYDECARAALVSVVLYLIGLAVFPDRMHLAPVSLVSLGLTAVVVGVLAVATWLILSPARFDSTSGPQLVAQLLFASGWLMGAARAAREARRYPWAGVVGSLFLGLAAVRALEAFAHGSLRMPFHVGAVLLAATVGSLAAYFALLALRAAVEADVKRLELAEHALTRAELGVAQRDAWREELSHDAINALAGLRAALTTLAQPAAGMTPEEIERLKRAAIREVAHLQHLVERSASDQPVEIEVAEVIETAVQTRQVAGLCVHVADAAGRAIGRPGDLATVLQNLLVNAARHAPGSCVQVAVREAAGRLGIMVADDGPGIPEPLRAQVFERGFAGPGSASTGLGLYVARQLMREQGGELELLPDGSGCVFLVTLPAAPRPEVPVACGGSALVARVHGALALSDTSRSRSTR